MDKILNIKVTSKCNYKCGMCPFHGEGYSTDYFGERPEWVGEIKLEDFEGMIKKAKDYGISTIDFTPNGEFFTYKKWREVLAIVQKYGMNSMLTTNGGLLTRNDIKEAVELGLSHVALSIDSVKYETYKIVRKPATKQAFENAIYAPIYFKEFSDSLRGGGLYVQVQFTKQQENEDEVDSMLEFYQPYKLNQISVNEMFKTSEEGIVYEAVKNKQPSYQVGTCASYGNSYLVQQDGSVLGCCGQFYFYPQIREKIPNIFKQSLEECIKQSDFLYKNDEKFIDYCKKCSLYSVNNQETLRKKFIKNGYFAMQYDLGTRYFVIPDALKNIPEEILLFMYEKGMVSEIKKFIQNNKEK